MKPIFLNLVQIAAAVQLAIAIMNVFIVRILNWKTELSRVTLLLREVFQVHAWFISITLGIFGMLSWRFAAEFAGHQSALCKWLACGIGLFWGIRTMLQVTYYSSSHWRGKPGRTVIHIALLLVYGGLSTIYLWVAFA